VRTARRPRAARTGSLPPMPARPRPAAQPQRLASAAATRTPANAQSCVDRIALPASTGGHTRHIHRTGHYAFRATPQHTPSHNTQARSWPHPATRSRPHPAARPGRTAARSRPHPAARPAPAARSWPHPAARPAPAARSSPHRAAHPGPLRATRSERTAQHVPDHTAQHIPGRTPQHVPAPSRCSFRHPAAHPQATPRNTSPATSGSTFSPHRARHARATHSSQGTHIPDRGGPNLSVTVRGEVRRSCPFPTATFPRRNGSLPRQASEPARQGSTPAAATRRPHWTAQRAVSLELG
jgi:hypothetical protein